MRIFLSLMMRGLNHFLTHPFHYRLSLCSQLRLVLLLLLHLHVRHLKNNSVLEIAVTAVMNLLTARVWANIVAATLILHVTHSAPPCLLGVPNSNSPIDADLV